MFKLSPPPGSTESRIIFDSMKLEKMEYDVMEYQARFYYFNRILRPSYYRKALIKTNDYFDHCYDCTYFSYLVQNYLNRIGDNDNIFNTTDVYKIMREITETIAKLSRDRIADGNNTIRNNIF